MAPDLSPDGSPKGRQVYTVTEFNRAVRAILETEFSTIWIEGEISNLRIPSSGHCYFTLKDDQSQIRAVFFKNAMRLLKFKPADGMKVILRGRVSVYEQRGEYQVIADLLEPKGKGSLQEAFEQLKKKLAEEGLFDPKFKKPIPLYPNRIVLVTSPTGAAIRDLIRIITRRYDPVRILLIPVRVQGEGAAQEIAAAVALANRIPDADVIIVGRGGGSLEDLWAFNEEIVARAIFDSRIPVVSAVGHETDFTIADFVADLRASTPSAAAELVVPEKEGLVRFVQDCRRRLARTLGGRIETERDRLENLLARRPFGSPFSTVGPHLIRLDDLRERAVRAVNRQTKGQKQEIARFHKRVRQLNPVLRVKRLRILLSERGKKLVAAGKAKSQVSRTRAEGLVGRFLSRAPKDRVGRGWERLSSWKTLLRERATERMKSLKDTVLMFSGKLDTLSPLATLSRGYSISRLAVDGSILKDASRLREGDRVEVTLHRGGFLGSVSEVIPPPREIE